jgi:hypothetical protein
MPETAHCYCHCLRVGGRLRPDLWGDSTYALWLAISTYARRTLTYPGELSVKPTRGFFRFHLAKIASTSGSIWASH